ncbi:MULTISPECIES: hypothetical protein [Shewanella]|uniref:hypothetical protein n=1 Tax=Shewanella TaxID=22 RepID=UPI001CF3FE19|nr:MULTISPECIES: hypothetical protein [unclassified Shewanella]MCB2383907.1 hypothetical protein [Shewanella sp. SR1]MDT3295835.1 hypothetical protein [Shewanella sp. SP2S2-6]
MSITGKEAVVFLSTIEDRVSLFKKDNTDKFWSYKIKSAKKTEFAFDPNTKTGLFIRIDREPPVLAGVENVERISGKDVSTALGRVFSGGLHKANYQASIKDVSVLESLISYYESL